MDPYSLRLSALLGKQEPTHVLVNPVIQGLLSAGPASAGPLRPNTILSALKRWRELKANWADHAFSGNTTIRVLELGFDLTERPNWLGSNKHVEYLGLRQQPQPNDANPTQRDVRIVDFDWTASDSLGQFYDKRLPDWIFAIDVLDRVEDPVRLLKSVADLYPPGCTGHMLVATRSNRVFGSTYEVDGTGVHLTLRSRRRMRRYFRDAGIEVVDEASPTLPREMGDLRINSESIHKKIALGLPPLHLWLLELHGTKTRSVDSKELGAWLNELGGPLPRLKPGSNPHEVTRHASARLLLSKIVDDAEGVQMRCIEATRTLLSARNTGGRLFLVRRGSFGAYHPESDTAKTSEPIVRLTRGPNEVAGELEVFSEDSGADRLYMMSMHALPPTQAHEVLVVPTKVVQRLLTDETVLGNPFLRDLRSKTLEAELGVRRNFAQRRSGRRPSTDKGDPNTTFHFSGRWGLRKVTPASIGQVACLIERALEADREWGNFHKSGLRIALFSNFHEARTQLFGTDPEQKKNSNANAAVQFLEACGVIRALCLSTHVPAPEAARLSPPKGFREHIVPHIDKVELEKHFFKVRAAARATSKNLRLEEELERVQAGAYEHFNKRFIEAHGYVMVLVESEFLLRRFAMELNTQLLEEVQFSREYLSQPGEEATSQWDFELAQLGVEFFAERVKHGAAHIDSVGMRLFPSSD